MIYSVYIVKAESNQTCLILSRRILYFTKVMKVERIAK
jgi:hypothetical protein